MQIYTSMAYEGPPVVKEIKRELAVILKYVGWGVVLATMYICMLCHVCTLMIELKATQE